MGVLQVDLEPLLFPGSVRPPLYSKFSGHSCMVTACLSGSLPAHVPLAAALLIRFAPYTRPGWHDSAHGPGTAKRPFHQGLGAALCRAPLRRVKGPCRSPPIGRAHREKREILGPEIDNRLRACGPQKLTQPWNSGHPGTEVGGALRPPRNSVHWPVSCPTSTQGDEAKLCWLYLQ